MTDQMPLMTASGLDFYPLAPDPAAVRIEDIAHALSNICRYGGHVREFYSVAQHSVLLSRAAPLHLGRWALLHDAAEAYVGDIPRPLKRHLVGYEAIEAGVMAAIVTALGLSPAEMPPEVKAMDNAIIADEARALMPERAKDWPAADGELGIDIVAWSPQVARKAFMAQYNWLKLIELKLSALTIRAEVMA
jgi:hypothetical protein